MIGGMAASAEFSQIIESLLPGNQQFNANGIYKVNLYIRGKPWSVLVDDIMLFKKKANGIDSLTLKAALVSKDRALWGPIVEKAWAKVVGNYANADYGLLKTGLRVVTGAPTFGYSLS